MRAFQLIVGLTLALSFYGVNAVEPLPATAFPVTPPDPIKGYAIVDNHDGVYFITEGAYWSMAVVGSHSSSSGNGNGRGNGRGNGNGNGNGNGYGNNNGHGSSSGSSRSSTKKLLLVDAPTGFWNTSKFNAMLRELTHKAGVSSISDLLYSHHHTDHIGSSNLVKQMFPNVQIHAATEVCNWLKKTKDSRRPVPQHCYTGNFSLSDYGVTAYAIGDAHSFGNRAIYVAKSKVLMYIDIVFPGWTMFRDLAQAEFSPAFYEAHDKILSFDFKIYVGGHLTRLGNRHDVLVQKEYVHDLMENGKYALDRINWGLAATAGTFDPNSPNYLNYWYLWSLVQGDIVNICNQRTLDKWDGKLGAVDLWTETHCFRVIESLQID
jgi:glyoxylase-like metal-dependent hydrolase (beta-lactamase superfamily II)